MAASVSGTLDLRINVIQALNRSHQGRYGYHRFIAEHSHLNLGPVEKRRRHRSHSRIEEIHVFDGPSWLLEPLSSLEGNRRQVQSSDQIAVKGLQEGVLIFRHFLREREVVHSGVPRYVGCRI